ncbi:MAG: cyclic nucleotide-binding domain-containing protein [Candidatus Limnocylindria bacterium]
MTFRETITHLKAVPLFSTCTVKQLLLIGEHGWEQEYPAGHVLCAEGKRGDDFFVILDGSARASRKGRTLRTLGPGDFFGEIGLLDNGERTATVTATTPLRCFILRRSDFKAAIYAEDIAVKLLYAMAQRLRAEITLPHD